MTIDNDNIKYERCEFMQNSTATISVEIEKHDKEIATGILNNLGLNM